MRVDDPADLFRRWLAAVGHVGDPEMAATPERFTELLREFTPQPDDAVLGNLALVGADGVAHTPVAVRNMPFHSLCAHHLVAFFGHATVAYTPNEKLAGFGSIARVVQHYARRPQLQERMAEQIADGVAGALQPKGLVVRLVARQLCMEMRGARTPGDVEVIATRGDVDDRLFALARG